MRAPDRTGIVLDGERSSSFAGAPVVANVSNGRGRPVADNFRLGGYHGGIVVSNVDRQMSLHDRSCVTACACVEIIARAH